MNIITTDYTLDCWGLSCPMPLLKTHKTLAIMTSGEILELLGKSAQYYALFETDETKYDQLIDLIFEHDQIIT